MRVMDALLNALGGGGIAGVVKAGTAILTVLLVVPALLKLFVVTVDEGWAAIRTRNGKPIVRKPNARSVRSGAGTAGEVVVLHPGSHGAFPLFYWYKLVDVRVRATDLPARQLTGASGHQHLVHASFEWRPLATGRDLRVFELDVVDVKERAANIVGASLRDVVRAMEGERLPHNAELGIRVLQECSEKTLAACGVEILSVVITGDALTDGHLLSQALTAGDRGSHAVATLHALN